MGIKPLGKCTTNFCTERAISHGKCARHIVVFSNNSDPFYKNPAWQKASRAFLKKHMLCEKCRQNDRVSIATVVDHRQPIKKGGDPWKRDNWAPLCASCHGFKRSFENRDAWDEFYEAIP